MGVLVLVEHEDLLIDGIIDSTNSWQVFWGGKPSTPNPIKKREELIDVCLHRRLVLRPHAIPLMHFSSKRELISVLIDIVISE